MNGLRWSSLSLESTQSEGRLTSFGAVNEPAVLCNPPFRPERRFGGGDCRLFGLPARLGRRLLAHVFALLRNGLSVLPGSRFDRLVYKFMSRTHKAFAPIPVVQDANTRCRRAKRIPSDAILHA